MAFGEVTGLTVQEAAEKRHEYRKSPKYENTGIPFEEAYCLSRIGKQPDDYDGPTRYCGNRVSADEGATLCRFHGKGIGGRKENLLPPNLANLRHGMHALPETIRETLSDEENTLLDDILTWPDTYGIDLDADPGAAHSFDTLALEIVRQYRGVLYILTNYEVNTKGVYAGDGSRLIDEHGQPVSEDVPNSLTQAYQAQVRLVESMKDSLGITRKQQKQNEQSEDRTAVMDDLAGALSSLIGSESSYDPEAFGKDAEAESRE